MNVIPENILSKMEPSDRAKLPKGVRFTIAERQARLELRLEREMHNGFESWLNLRKKIFAFVHTNPTRKSTIKKGWPDFTILYSGRVLLIEFKVPPNKLTEDQLIVFAELSAAGNEVIICTSLTDAIHLTIERFNLPPSWNELQ